MGNKSRYDRRSSNHRHHRRNLPLQRNRNLLLGTQQQPKRLYATDSLKNPPEGTKKRDPRKTPMMHNPNNMDLDSPQTAKSR
jgi:hypothetical protein